MAEPNLSDASIATELAGPAGELGAVALERSQPEPRAVVAPAGGRRRREVLRHVASLSPFTLFVGLFLIVPAGAVCVGAFEKPSGGFTWSNVSIALSASNPYRQGFVTSLELSLLAAVIPAAVGLVIAYAVHTAPERSALRRVVISTSGVFANFGGVPLAFIFLASIGASGLATGWLGNVGIHINTQFLYSFSGVTFIYMYFQIPLMVLVILPALEGLKASTREAAHNLGARSYQYWLHVGGPVLLPSVLGAMLLLFGFALAAYATADALTSGTMALTSIQIGSFLNGNVAAGQENVGKALAMGMLVILAVVMTVYSVLQRKANRWQQ